MRPIDTARLIEIKTSMTCGDTGKINIMMMAMINPAKIKSLELEMALRIFSPPNIRDILSKYFFTATIPRSHQGYSPAILSILGFLLQLHMYLRGYILKFPPWSRVPWLTLHFA